MKKISFILLLTILGSHLAAQNVIRFNRLYTIILGQTCVSTRIFVSNNGYVLWGSATDSNSLYALNNIALVKIDTLGKLLWAKTYGAKGYNYFESNIIQGGGGGVAVPWGGYIEPVTITDSPIKWLRMALFRFDNNGDTIWTKIYNDTINELAIVVKVTQQKQYVVGGESVVYDTIKGYKFFYTTLMKTDSLGNKIWQKTYYGAPGHARESLALDTCADGGYIIAAYDEDTNSCCTGRIFIMKTDSAGNTQWTRYVNSPKYCNAASGAIITLRKGGYIVSAEYDDSLLIGCNYTSRMFMFKLSDTGNILWENGYGHGHWYPVSGLQMAKELPNGDIIACGEDSAHVLGCILKIDSNGNQLWLRYYKMQSPNEQDYLLDIQPTSDGGFISCGSTYGSTENIWVVKTDSNGCADSAGCFYTGVSAQLKMDNRQWAIYPNPNDGVFTLQMNSKKLKVKSEVEIYNMMGEQIKSEELRGKSTAIDISNQSSGIYLYRVTSEDGKLVGEGKFIIEK